DGTVSALQLKGEQLSQALGLLMFWVVSPSFRFSYGSVLFIHISFSREHSFPKLIRIWGSCVFAFSTCLKLLEYVLFTGTQFPQINTNLGKLCFCEWHILILC